MGELVFIGVASAKRDASVEQAWQRFVEAKNKSEETLRLEDGLEARKAYREFLELYQVRK